MWTYSGPFTQQIRGIIYKIGGTEIIQTKLSLKGCRRQALPVVCDEYASNTSSRWTPCAVQLKHTSRDIFQSEPKWRTDTPAPPRLQEWLERGIEEHFSTVRELTFFTVIHDEVPHTWSSFQWFSYTVWLEWNRTGSWYNVPLRSPYQLVAALNVLPLL